MKLVAGLGNPGDRYKNTRHNIGFLVIDHLAARQNWVFKKKKYYEFVAERDFVLIKPRTFMNNSGVALTSALTSYPVEETLVIFDDASLPFGALRFRHKGSAGGHNGLKSIAYHLGSDEFKRFRIGIDAPAPQQDLADYVLSNFSPQEDKFLPEVVDYCAKLLHLYLLEDFDSLLDFHSKNMKTYSEKLEAFQDL
jgi:peptidyl-tRNA hydrolase, PTH1 family